MDFHGETLSQEGRGKIKVTFGQAVRIVAPYTWHQLMEQVVVVVPVVAYLALFQWIVLGWPLARIESVTGGITLVILGLMFFMEGVKIGILPMGEAIGRALPQRSGIAGLLIFSFLPGLVAASGLSEMGNQVGQQLPHSFHPPDKSLYPPALGKMIVVAFGGILGYGATLAEPAFNTLGQQVEEVTQGAFKKWLFSQAVAIGVGIGAALGMASLIYGLDLLKLLLPPYVVLFFLTLVSNEKYNSIAWDGGAVTTGPVTVPLKIAIGIALSHATGFAEGFGILALASAYPVMNILIIGLYVQRQQRRMGGFA